MIFHSNYITWKNKIQCIVYYNENQRHPPCFYTGDFLSERSHWLQLMQYGRVKRQKNSLRLCFPVLTFYYFWDVSVMTVISATV